MNELEQMIISNLAWIAIIIIAFLFVTCFIVIVPQSKKYIIERLGKYSRTLGPGISFLIPIIDSVAHRVDIRERVVPETLSKRINVVTKDNGVVSLDISAYYRVTEPQNLVYRITDIDSSVADVVVGIVRGTAGQYEFDQLQSNRSEMNQKMLPLFRDSVANWGVEATRCEIISIAFDEETEISLRQQLAAERERRAEILKAEGQKRAVELNAEAQRFEIQQLADAAVYDATRRAEAAVAEAKGIAEATILKAEGEAQALNEVGNSLAANQSQLDVGQFEIAKGQLAGLYNVAQSANTKVMFVPADATQTFAKLAEIFPLGQMPISPPPSSGPNSNNAQTPPAGPWNT